MANLLNDPIFEQGRLKMLIDPTSGEPLRTKSKTVHVTLAIVNKSNRVIHVYNIDWHGKVWRHETLKPKEKTLR